MAENNRILVGYDLCDNYSQIGFYNTKLFEPTTIEYGREGNNDRIPTVMAVTDDTKEWLFGEDAVKAVKLQNAQPVDNILEHIRKKEKYIIFEKEFEPVEILAKYFTKTLLLLKKIFPSQTIGQLVVTVKDTNPVLVEGIFAALRILGLEKDRVSVLSHAQSYTYYALSQKKELWMNDVALFDFDSEGLKYYQIKIDRQHRPITVGINSTDYTEMLSYDLFGVMYDEQLQYIFENITRTALYKQIISTIYVTGVGFDKPWAEDIIKNLCVGRRGFIGQNLFSGGACYAAKNMAGDEDKFADFMFLSEDMITGTISVWTYSDATKKELIFSRMATPWYEADSSHEFILDDLDEIEIMVKNDVRNTKKSHFIVLDGLPKRPAKTTRIRIRVKFLDPKSCVVTIKDMGFGEIYKGTDRVWEKIITI